MRIAVLTTDHDSAREVTAGPASIDADGTFTATYSDPGPSAHILLRFTYSEAPGAADRTWLALPELGRLEFNLPSGAAPTSMGETTLDFLPSRHGFRFVNHFEGSPLPQALVRAAGIQLEAFGLCGGMSFAAADLFRAARARPEASSPPPEGSPLFGYIYRRQVNSLGALSIQGLRFGRWMVLPRGTVAGTEKRTYDELAPVRALLDAGQPAVLGLNYVGGEDGRAVWQNHQVLAFGYRTPGDGMVVIRIYDPNYPGRDDVTIRAKTTVAGRIDDPLIPGGSLEVPGLECRQFVGERDLRPVRGFFVMPYSPAAPPDDLSSEGTGPLHRTE